MNWTFPIEKKKLHNLTINFQIIITINFYIFLNCKLLNRRMTDCNIISNRIINTYRQII